jgi:hypothetical protein
MIVFGAFKVNFCDWCPQKRSAWNGSDYQSNSDYYKQLIDMHDFGALKLDFCDWSAKKRSAWNDSDYQSNSDYYKQLIDMHDFGAIDNLRLDRLSSPRFHPTHGKTVIYLRQQYHMPDLKGSSTTLHWINLETNKTVQLTRPIWGIHDQQVNISNK